MYHLKVSFLERAPERTSALGASSKRCERRLYVVVAMVGRALYGSVRILLSLFPLGYFLCKSSCPYRYTYCWRHNEISISQLISLSDLRKRSLSNGGRKHEPVETER